MNNHYQHIVEALRYIEANRKAQPKLEEVASHVGLSPSDLQGIFARWAGEDWARFMQYLSVEYAKRVLQSGNASLLAATSAAGQADTGGRQNPSVHIEGMTPGKYGHEGRDLQLHYVFADSPFGEVLIASTVKGISYIAFTDGKKEAALAGLRGQFACATLVEQADEHNACAVKMLGQDWSNVHDVRLHLRATAFQLKVWEALLKVPMGQLTTYGKLAQAIGQDEAARAVGSAVAGNPVALLIPCHRVIRSTGELGHYHWTAERKAAIIGWEAAHCKGNIGAAER